jgi:hypothetical protein
MKNKLIVALMLIMLGYSTNIKTTTNDKHNTLKELDEQISAYKNAILDYKSKSIADNYTLKGNYNESVRLAIRELALKLQIEEEWVYRLFDLESRGNPQAQNIHSKATGLIQFMPATAKNLGTTIEDLKKMSIEEQLVYVEKYLTKIKNKQTFDSFLDFYLAVFYPKGIGKPLTYVIGSEHGYSFAKKVAKQNAGIDRAGNNDGFIQKSDIDKWIS